jgi:N-acetylglucosamine kinase-like BadF-type ATPase
MAFFLAVDAGGTKTDIVLADETRELARVRTGTIKRLRTDAATATANLESALRELTAETGISMQSITRTCVGTAGETVPLVRDWLRESITARVSGELILLGDVEIALDAAFFGRPGVLAMAGTGSNVAGRACDGTLTTAGGWGPALGDQGSGHRIGSEALRAMFLAKDDGRETSLFDAVLMFWQLKSLDLLVEYANQQPAPDFSRLTEVVLRCAEQGDAVAAEVLQREGEALAHQVRLVVRRVQRTGQFLESSKLPAIAFTGSILEHVLPVRAALIAAVRAEFPAIEMHDEVVDPIVGAMWRARSGGFGALEVCN